MSGQNGVSGASLGRKGIHLYVGEFTLPPRRRLDNHRGLTSWFNRRRPALLDNPIHMLISPMYVFARLFIALGFRPDLATVLQKSSEQIAHESPLHTSEYRADTGRHP